MGFVKIKSNFLSIRIVLLLGLLNINGASYSQSTEHFFIGSTELAGIDIYSVYKTKKTRDLYIATSNGVFIYKNNVFVELKKSKDQKGSSFFQIKENSKGEVFCNNLYGQVFRLKKDALILYYEVNKDYIGDQFQCYFDDKDQLLFSSNVFGKIDKNLVTTVIKKPICDSLSTCQFYSSSPLEKNRVLLCHPYIDSALIYNKGNLEPLILPSNVQNKISGYQNLYSIVELEKQTFLFVNDGQIIPFESSVSIPQQYKNERYFKLNSRQIIALNPKSGGRILTFEQDKLQEQTILQNLFLSDVHIDVNGALYFGTFGNGICIVPDFNTKSIQIDASLRGITVNNKGECFISSKEGIIYKYKDSVTVYFNSERPLDWLFSTKYISASTKNVTSQILFDPVLNQSSGVIKDYYEASDKNTPGLVATSTGIFALTSIKLNENVWSNKNNNWQLKNVTGRQKTVAYLAKTKCIYYSDGSNLNYIDSNGIKKELKTSSLSHAVNDMEFKGDTLICATENGGLTFFYKNQFIYSISEKEGLKSNKLKKIKFINNLLLINTQRGFQSYDFRTKTFQNYGVLEGVIENTIIDFDATTSHIFLLLKNKLIKLAYKKTSFNRSELALKILKANVGTHVLSQSGNNNLSFDQNKLLIEFDFISEVLKEETEVYYKLIGSDVDWILIPKNFQSIQYQALAPGEYMLMIETRCRGLKSEMITYNFTIYAPYWQRWWFLVLIGLLLLTISFLFYRRRLHIQNQKALQINELNASKLTAIQSQMNPHFIFNSLNAIQDLVLKGDISNSYTFITKFSNLVRKTLSFSDKEFIDFDKEISLIELYLSLEKLRFKESLEITLLKDGIDDILIPPMLIQPFIENSLLHGLLHKEGVKKLTISFELKEHLICKIMDNGIGRGKSKEIKERQRAEHESFSSGAIAKRFEILQKHFGGNLGFKYEDLTEAGKLAGTIVTLKIPIKHLF